MICRTLALTEEDEKEKLQETKKMFMHLANKYPNKKEM